MDEGTTVGDEVRARLREAIREHVADHGFSPSYRELAERCEVSLSQVHYHLRMMRAAGVVTYVDGQPRTVRLVEVQP